MKKKYITFMVLLTALLLAAIGIQPEAMAQVPSGVMVDSIGAAVSWRNESPFRSHHFLQDPKTGKMVFVGGQTKGDNNATNPAWYSSSDNGTTWSLNAQPFTNNQDAGAVAIAADSNFVVYVAYDRGDSLMFDKDAIGGGLGLGNEVFIANPAQCPDIAVSKDGKHIIITAQPTHGDYDSLTAYVSTDGGTTWSTNLALYTRDASLTPAPPANASFQWDVTSLSMGTGGYAFVVGHVQYNSNFRWNLISETTDYGATWKESWAGIDTTKYYPTGSAWDFNGQVLAVGNVPHFATIAMDANGNQVLIETHKSGSNWVRTTISHPDTIKSLSYLIPRDGNLSIDAQGRLYAVWTDQNLSLNSTYQIFASGSSDGGNTWTQPVRLTDDQSFCVGNQVLNSPMIPPYIGSTTATIAINGQIFGLFPGGDPTAWVEAQFPLSAVWNGPFDKDTVQRVLQAKGYASTFGHTGYSWVDITKLGVEVDTLLHDIPSGSPDGDDGAAGMFPIGFDFPLYGTSYSQFEVFANGFISFTDTSGLNWPPPFPVNRMKTMLAVFGSDPNHDMHNPQLFYWTNAAKDTCIIEWYHETSYDSPTDTTMTFEIILSKTDSSVTYQYTDVGPSPQTMHVLVQGGTGLGVNLNKSGFVPDSGSVVRVHPSSATAVIRGPNLPGTYALSQNYPNPFNPSTEINYAIPKSGFVSLKIYNILGQEVTTLVSGNQKAGNYRVSFDASKLASGVYLYRLQAGDFTSVKKMILMK